MLESQKLWLQLWWDYRKQANGQAGPPPPNGAPIWALVEPNERELLGVVRRRQVQSAWVWFGSIAWPVVEVLESQDESLLFTLDRYVGFRASWLVRDADGHRLGTIRGQEVRDSCGQALGSLEWSNDRRLGHWRGMGGQELGSLHRFRGGLEVRFGPELDENPFAKMVFLATLLREE
jgi:hypothetical protein